MNTMLSRRHLPRMSPRRYQEHFDFPVDRYYTRLGFDFTRETFEALGTEFILAYEQSKHRCRLQPGARALLASLSDRGVRQFVLSAYRHDSLSQLLRDKGLDVFFDDISGADDHYARGKVEQGLRLIRKLALSPAETILVGDTTHDYEVAHAMGLSCMLVESGHHHRDKLAACPCPIFSNLYEIQPALMENN